MPNILYFSHSYRPEDAAVNDYFARLLKSEQLIPSLDPPSETVNSAKLERHLNYSDGMVAVLTAREGGVSQHILYEISLAVRGRKPMVVFVEDSLPTDIIPRRLLQHRFSRRSFLRQIREHRQVLRMLRSYLGEQAAPRYQLSASRRSCLVVGGRASAKQDDNSLNQLLHDVLGYEPVPADPDTHPLGENQNWWDLVSTVDIVLAMQSNAPTYKDAYLLGAVRGALRPLIVLTADKNYLYTSGIPMEYQPRQVGRFDLDSLRPVLLDEFALFEEDFLDLDDQGEVTRYSEQLIELDGQYGPETREQVLEVVMGDKYEVSGQAGAVGPKAHVHDINFNQIWSQSKSDLDLQELARQLDLLRREARDKSISPEDDDATAELGKAQRAAEEGDGAKALSHLARSGRWALSLAQGIGVGVATAAIKSALGL